MNISIFYLALVFSKVLKAKRKTRNVSSWIDIISEHPQAQYSEMSGFLSNLDTLISATAALKTSYIADELISFTSADVADGVGVVAKQDIDTRTLLIQVPLKACISVETITKSQACNSGLKAIFEDNPGLLSYPDEVLAIGLMYAFLHPDDSTCFWAPHVQTMPSRFNSTIYWTENERMEIKNSMTFHLTNMMKRQIEVDYDGVHKALIENYPAVLGGASIGLYTWALNAVYSRAIDITKGNQHVRIIVPLVDMANHDPHLNVDPSDTLHYDESLDVIQLICPVARKAGDECCIVYGKYPNAKLLFNYGFAVLNNPHKAIDLWTKLPPTSYQYEYKQKVLQSNELTSYQSYDFKGTIRENYIAPALLATIRVIQSDEIDLPQVNNAFKGKMISVRNEMASYVSLRGLLVNRMKAEGAEVGIQYL